jgi:hypothetical protein
VEVSTVDKWWVVGLAEKEFHIILVLLVPIKVSADAGLRESRVPRHLPLGGKQPDAFLSGHVLPCVSLAD